jgi:copper chaperone CopZ
LPEKLQHVLILAHPGHELRIHHWLELRKPRIYLLTDGSGGHHSSRTQYSRDVVEATGATAGAVFGDIPDATWYKALLAGDIGDFTDVLSRISVDVSDMQDVQIVSDAVDGYNPMHDLAYAFGNALDRLLQSTKPGRKQLCSAAVPNVPGVVEVEIQLDSAARARKMAAVKAYTPLADEARQILNRDPQCFDRELLISQHFDWDAPWTPVWERIGKERVANKLYDRCITYRENVQPVAQQLMSESDRNHVSRKVGRLHSRA